MNRQLPAKIDSLESASIAAELILAELGVTQQRIEGLPYWEMGELLHYFYANCREIDYWLLQYDIEALYEAGDRSIKIKGMSKHECFGECSHNIANTILCNLSSESGLPDGTPIGDSWNDLSQQEKDIYSKAESGLNRQRPLDWQRVVEGLRYERFVIKRSQQNSRQRSEALSREGVELLDCVYESGALGVLLCELPQSARLAPLLTVLAADRLIEFWRRCHCHVGGELQLEDRWEMQDLLTEGSRRMTAIIAEDLKQQKAIRLYVRATVKGEVALSRLELATLEGEPAGLEGLVEGGKHRVILQAMMELGAKSLETRQNQQQIAGRAIGQYATSEDVKDEMSELKRRELIDSKTGRSGGSWLTSKGIEAAQHIKSKSEKQ